MMHQARPTTSHAEPGLTRRKGMGQQSACSRHVIHTMHVHTPIDTQWQQAVHQLLVHSLAKYRQYSDGMQQQ